MIRKTIKKLKRLLIVLSKESPVWISSHFTKKDNNIWVFGAIRGQKYMDNAKYLFEYVHHHTNRTAIWISKNPEVVEDLKSKGYNAFYEYTTEAIDYAKKAKVAIITHRGSQRKADLPFYAFSKQTEVIQLWHGIPLKKIAFDDKVFSFKQNEDSLKWKITVFLKKKIFPFLNYVHEPSLIPALSEETQNIFSQAFRIPKSNVVITGYPRNDILLRNAANKRDKQTFTKKIIYMPTFRGSVHSDFDLFLQYGFDVDTLDIFLSKENIVLDIKLHPFNNPSEELIKRLERSERIVFLNHDNIYETLYEYDMLITDYSSIYFDFLLLERPIIFAPFDKTNFLQNDRKFYFDYDKVTPGPKASNWSEVIELIQEFLQNKNLYKEERDMIKNRFHTYQDTSNSKRVYEAIASILSNN
jgi:CDP-glycerol glycerophosphotransferase